jgi:tetratricopeptide (TPR) repeat protein
MSDTTNMSPATMAILLQQRLEIYSLNHNGIQLLKRGLYDDAITTFTHALVLVKYTYQQQEQATRCCNPKSSFPAAVSAVSSFYSSTAQQVEDWGIADWFSQCILKRRRIEPSLKSSSSSDFSSFFGYVYQDALEIPLEGSLQRATTTANMPFSKSPPCPRSVSSLLPLQVHSVSVMFNLALSCHTQGLSLRRQGQFQEGNQALDHARGLYELSYEMMASEKFNPGVYLIMAIANNLGQLYYMLENYTKARHCWNHLLSIQMFVTQTNSYGCVSGIVIPPTTILPSHHHHHGNNSMTTSDINQERVIVMAAAAWEGFSQSASMLILTDGCAPAA